MILSKNPTKKELCVEIERLTKMTRDLVDQCTRQEERFRDMKRDRDERARALDAAKQEHQTMKSSYDKLRVEHADQLQRADNIDTDNSQLHTRLREVNEVVAGLRRDLAHERRETDKWKRAVACIAEPGREEPIPFGNHDRNEVRRFLQAG